MSSPGIEIAWGGGAWPRRRKNVVMPTIQGATELAAEALAEAGYEYGQPKRVNIWRTSRSEESLGLSDGATDIVIHVRDDHIKHRKVAKMFITYFLTVGHELTHAIRSEYFPDDSLVERVASEGLAYVTEDLMNSMTLLPGEAPLVGSLVHREAFREVADLKHELVRAHNATASVEQLESAYSQWTELCGRTPPPGIKVGIVEVYQRLIEGYDLAELISMPAEVVLGLTQVHSSPEQVAISV